MIYDKGLLFNINEMASPPAWNAETGEVIWQGARFYGGKHWPRLCSPKGGSTFSEEGERLLSSPWLREYEELARNRPTSTHRP
ncbi:MAG: hypothetical protein R2748_32650 [Bryobacterales bacterium]